LKTRVENDAQAKQDFFAPTNALCLQSDSASSRLLTPCGEFHLRSTAHTHVAELAGIDKRYYHKLREHAPELLDENVNHWLKRGGKGTRVIRALGEDARAIVSPRYAALDNDALLKTLEPLVDELGASIETCDLSDEHLVLKLVTPRLQGEVQRGDEVQAGLVVQNSEVRAGALCVQPLIYRLVCTNGLIAGRATGTGSRRRHSGRNWIDSTLEAGGQPDDDFSHLGSGIVPQNPDRVLWEANIWNDLRNDVRETLSAESFQKLLQRLSLTTQLHTGLDPDDAVRRLAAHYRLGDELQSRITHHLGQNYHGTLWDVVNAVTRSAQDVSSFTVATDLEELGGELSHLTARRWERLMNLN
jgi:hypothetical protein